MESAASLDWQFVLRALCLAVALEGCFWALFPSRMRGAAEELARRDDAFLRRLGLAAFVGGVVACRLLA